MSSFLELIKAAVYDNWKVYKLYSQAKRRDALSTAILLGCSFPEDRFLEIHRSVETLSTNFRRDFQQRSDEVEKELSLMKKTEKRRFKVCFEVNGKEISDAEITEWLGKHHESDPAMIKEEGGDDSSDVKHEKDTADDVLHEVPGLEVLSFFHSFILSFFSPFSPFSFLQRATFCLYLA